jgi:transcription factor SPT20
MYNKLGTVAEANLLPIVPSDAHILKKYKGSPPSLIVHLHPTHFRFDQQDGSFSYHSEMRLFIEHLQKKTIPHDMLEEFKAANVQFYEGWLIVRVVDHKSVSAAAGPSSNNDPDDQVPFSIHNYNQYITPSPWVPYPVQEPPKPSFRGRSSPIPKQESAETSNSQMNGGSSTLNGDAPSGKNSESASRANKPQPKIYHVALRPTNLSKHMDIVIDSMTPDSRTMNRRQSQAFSARTPGTTNMPAPGTPLSAVPPTPSLEKGPPPKRQKMKVDPKDLLDYEAGIVRGTAPPIFLDPVNNFEEAQALQHFLRDPLYDEEPPSPKGRKRTVAELAADDALAKEQERFMLIMDERNSGGSATVNTNTVDGQAAAGLFQPRFERFNALDNIKTQAHERKQREAQLRIHLQEAQQAAKAQQDEDNKRNEMMRLQQVEMRRRQMQHERQQQQQAALAAQQQHAIPQLNGVPPNMQRQMMPASQAQGASPVVRTSTPHINSSPIVGQTRPGHGVPMTVTSSSQGGAGSPPRPGSALQHGHPGIAMVRSQSNQGPSRNGTPQVPHSTPGMSHATPVMRHGTPAQQISQASPHGSMMAHTPQMGHAMMGPGQMSASMAQNTQAAQMQAHQQQQQQQQQHLMLQRQQQNLARQGMHSNMPNGGQQYSQEQIAQLQVQAHQHARMAQQQAALQQQLHQSQQGRNQAHSGGQTPAQSQAAYQAALVASQKSLMEQAVNQQGSPPQPQPTPQQHTAQLQHQASMQQQLAQNQGQGLQLPNGMSPQHQQHLQHQQQQQLQRAQQMHNSLMASNPLYAQQYTQRSQQLFKQNLTQLIQQAGGDQSRIPQQQVENLKMQVSQRAMRDVQEMMKRQQQQARAHQQQMGVGGPVGGAPNPAIIQQMQAQQQAQLQAQRQNEHNMLQYQQHLQQMQQGHQGSMMSGVPGAGVMPK